MANDIRIQVTVDDDASPKLKNIGNTSDDVFRGMTRAALSFGAAFASAQVVGSIASFGRDIVTAASDASESLSKLRVVFGDQSAALEEFSANSARAFGLSTRVTTEYLGTFGNLLTSMGLSQAASSGMSKNIVQLAADLASFNNLAGGVPEALEKIRAGLVGEAEPLRALGVNLNEVSIQQEAMRLGILKTGETLSAANKAQASYSLILKQTTNAQGDYARTSDGLANTQRTLSARVADLKEKLGVALLPAVQDVTGALSELIDKNGEKWAEGFAGAVNGITKAFSALGDSMDKAKIKQNDFIKQAEKSGAAARDQSGFMQRALTIFTSSLSASFLGEPQGSTIGQIGAAQLSGFMGRKPGNFNEFGDDMSIDVALKTFNEKVEKGIENFASSSAAKIKTAAEKLADELETIQNRFLAQQVEAYIKGGDSAVQATRKSQEKLLDDAMVVAKHIADTYGVDISEVIGEALQSLTKQAQALEVATDAARRATFNLTKQLFDMARGPGGQLSPQVANEFAGVSEQATLMGTISEAMQARGISASAASDAINAAARSGRLNDLASMSGVTIVNNFNVPTNPTETAVMMTDMINKASATTGPLIASGAVSE